MSVNHFIRTALTMMLASSLFGCSPVTSEPEDLPSQETEDPSKENDKVQNEINMKMTVGEYVFDIEYVDSKTAEAFKAKLPMSLQMEELNGNEKYCYIDGSLPTAASNPGTINAGDLMLFGSNCIVVFYESFKTSYSYTRIGRVKDTANLKTALGSGNIEVTFD